MITYGFLYRLIIVAIYIAPLIAFIRHKAGVIRIAGLVLLCAYTVVFIGVTIFPIAYDLSILHRARPVVNLIPFRSTIEIFKHSSLGTALIQTAGNVLLFMPLGFLLPVISDRFKRFTNCLICILCVSACTELIQLLINLITGVQNRVTDIDDVILNTAGGLIGYVIYLFFNRIFQEKCKSQYN